MKKQKKYFLLVDCESCIDGTIYDLAVWVVCKKGIIHHRLDCIILENMNTELYHDYNKTGAFHKNKLVERHNRYKQLIPD